MRVFAAGTYDGCHPGHIGLFKQCWRAAQGGIVIVAVSTDEFVYSFRGKKPQFTLRERLIMVRSCRYVDIAIVNDGSDQPSLITAALPDGGVHISGDDWAPGNPEGKNYLRQIGLANDPSFYERNGIELRFVPRTGDWSSTEIRSRC